MLKVVHQTHETYWLQEQQQQIQRRKEPEE